VANQLRTLPSPLCSPHDLTRLPMSVPVEARPAARRVELDILLPSLAGYSSGGCLKLKATLCLATVCLQHYDRLVIDSLIHGQLQTPDVQISRSQKLDCFKKRMHLPGNERSYPHVTNNLDVRYHLERRIER
jgi:hypothetical protein